MNAGVSHPILFYVDRRFFSFCEFKFVLWLDIPVSNFSVISGRSNHFLGINQYYGEVMCLVQGDNTGPPVGFKSRDLSICSLMLYH